MWLENRLTTAAVSGAGCDVCPTRQYTNPAVVT